jgi:hypothetical protein
MTIGGHDQMEWSVVAMPTCAGAPGRNEAAHRSGSGQTPLLAKGSHRLSSGATACPAGTHPGREAMPNRRAGARHADCLPNAVRAVPRRSERSEPHGGRSKCELNRHSEVRCCVSPALTLKANEVGPRISQIYWVDEPAADEARFKIHCRGSYVHVRSLLTGLVSPEHDDAPWI